MKITFDPTTEMEELQCYLDDRNYRNALKDFGKWLRNTRKHGDTDPLAAKILDTVWDRYCKSCTEHNVDWMP